MNASAVASPQPPRDVTEAQPQQDTSEAELVCYETYAALGNILLDLAEHGHPQAEKLLDNLSQAKLVHKDVLPFDHGNVGVGEVHPCPLGKGCQPDPNCTNRAQCWEPCGLLGNDEKHVRAASAKDTAAINKALGVTACPHGVPHRWPCEKCDAPGVAALEPHPPSRKCGCAACAPSFASDDVSVQSEQPLAPLPREAMPEGGKDGANK